MEVILDQDIRLPRPSFLYTCYLADQDPEKLAAERTPYHSPEAEALNDLQLEDGPVWTVINQRWEPVSGQVAAGSLKKFGLAVGELAAAQPRRGRRAELDIPAGVVELFIQRSLARKPAPSQEIITRETAGMQVPFVPVQGLFVAMGQFGYIDLFNHLKFSGKNETAPVVYIDSDFAENPTVVAHELREIELWELWRTDRLYPGYHFENYEQLEKWIYGNENHYRVAVGFARGFHHMAPSVEEGWIAGRDQAQVAVLVDMICKQSTVGLFRAGEIQAALEIGQEDIKLLSEAMVYFPCHGQSGFAPFGLSFPWIKY